MHYFDDLIYYNSLCLILSSFFTAFSCVTTYYFINTTAFYLVTSFAIFSVFFTLCLCISNIFEFFLLISNVDDLNS